MSNEISRRDFLKAGGVLAGAAAIVGFDLKYGISALGRTFKRYIRQGAKAEGAEGASNHTLSVFVSDLDTQGGLVILDETAQSLFAITGQPKIGPDPQVDGSFAYFFEGGVQPITGNVKGKNTLDETYLFDEESREPRQSKHRTGANIGETIIRIATDNVAITPEAITKGQVGSPKYQKQLMANEKLINNLPQRFSEYGYTLVESPIGGTILGSAVLTETTNTNKGTSNLLVQFYVRAWRLDAEGNKIYNFLPVSKGGIRLNKLTHPLVANGPAFESVAGGVIKVAALDFVPEISVPTPHAPEPSLPANFPEDFKAQIGDKNWQVVDGVYQVMAADGNWQNWYETRPDGAVQTTDWKMHQDVPIQIGFEPQKNWHYETGGFSLLAFPVLTGESPVERQQVLNGQEITIIGIPASIRDIADTTEFVDILIPLIYKDKFGNVLDETWFFTEGGKQTVAEFLKQAHRGQQLEIKVDIITQKGICLGGLGCEMEFELNKAQGLNLGNMILRNGDILPVGIIRNYFKNGAIYRSW